MKLKILLLLSIAAFGFESCQSEYGERMSKALELKRKYQQVQCNLNDSRNHPVLKTELSNIEKEIKFHAAISGNETAFLEEIWNN